MTIKEFIETAIEGGWKLGVDAKNIPGFKMYDYGFIFGIELKSDIHINTIVLDPKVWQAVGKVKGWGKTGGEHDAGNYPDVMICGRFDKPSLGIFRWSVCEFKMHQMIAALTEGKSIEEYLQTL